MRPTFRSTVFLLCLLLLAASVFLWFFPDMGNVIQAAGRSTRNIKVTPTKVITVTATITLTTTATTTVTPTVPVTPTPTATPKPTPPSTTTSMLNGIAALSPTDMWAVGYSQISTGSGVSRKQSLIEHWNGQQWTIISSPNVGSKDTVLTGITAFATNTIWAVGYYQANGGSIYTLTEHWDGAIWTIVSSPNVS